MRCPKCKTENRQGARFCANCGASLVLACPQCGTELPAFAKFCDACGAQVTAQPAEVSEEPPAPRTLPERLQRLIPKQYAERLLASRGQMEHERRLVTILFTDVKGSTALAEKLDPEEWSEIMNGAYDFLVTPIYDHEGTLAQLLGDGLLAFFGAPLAHEDDPERAIRAGLDITSGMRSYAAKLQRQRGIPAFHVRVGINTGPVVIGEMGTDLRVAYTAMGDAINLAARMEQNAPLDSILITHDTYRHVRGVFDVLPQEPLHVKGKAEPVQTYLVQQAKPRAFRKPTRGVEGIETRMIGRDAELSRLQDAFYTAIEDRELQMVTVVGEAGVGKSRLLHEFDIWCELLPETFFYFRGRARQQTQNVPYALIRDLVAFRFQIRDTDPLPMVRDKLETGIEEALGAGESSAMRAHLIGHLVGFELGDSPHLAGVTDNPQETRERALTYLVDYFTALADRSGVLMLLEDLHWADNSSLDVLNDLALGLIQQPAMILSTARPSLFERRPHWGEGQPFHRRLPLEALTKRHARRLVDEILQRMDAVPDALRNLVVQNAEGNPFFVEELIKMLIEDGLIVAGEHEWHVELDRLSKARVPTTLNGVLQARLDRLPPEQRTVMQQASVVGRLFWDLAVVRISESAAQGIAQAEVLDCLSALRGREMVFQRETSAFAGAQEFVFKNALLRQATYESVLKRLRRMYHGLAADWLMEQGGERAQEYTALIADHLELAGRTKEAARYLVAAGDRARRLYAHQEAVGAYQRALALLQEQGDSAGAAAVLMKLGLTHHSAFDFAKSRQAYDEAFALQQVAAQASTAPLEDAPHALRTATVPPPTLDPGLAHDTSSGMVIDQLFSGLVELSPELDVVPDVASRWEILDGGRRYLFHLRDDVRWSDGIPLSAADFEFAWKRVLDPATSSLNASLLYGIRGARDYHERRVSSPDAVGVRALNDVTLEVQLQQPAGYFLYLLCQPATYPVPRHAVRARGGAWTEPTNIVTNGSFAIKAWQGAHVVLERSPDYHGRFSGNLRQVELNLVPSGEWQKRLDMYEADALDVVPLYDAPAPSRERIRAALRDDYVLVPEGGTFYIVFDVTRPPFDDARVRRAFVHALDRHALVKDVLGDDSVAATGGFVPQGMPGHTPGIALPYDPQRARQLLAEAGYPDGDGFPRQQLLIWPRRDEETRYMMARWREALGVELTVTRILAWGDYLDAVDGDPPPLYYMGWVPDYPDPDTYLRVPIRHQSKWRHPTYSELIDRALEVTDQRQRMRLYSEADRLLVQEAAIVPLSYSQAPLLIKPWVREYPVHAFSYYAWKHVIIEPH